MCLSRFPLDLSFISLPNVTPSSSLGGISQTLLPSHPALHPNLPLLYLSLSTCHLDLAIHHARSEARSRVSIRLLVLQAINAPSIYRYPSTQQLSIEYKQRHPFVQATPQLILVPLASRKGYVELWSWTGHPTHKQSSTRHFLPREQLLKLIVITNCIQQGTRDYRRR
jgi:hypothetical protein